MTDLVRRIQTMVLIGFTDSPASLGRPLFAKDKQTDTSLVMVMKQDQVASPAEGVNADIIGHTDAGTNQK